jgi:poly-gamma-glutamate synthesis protein (capsule biosynthesis protein)
VIQGVEMRRGRPIFYSIGNFIMRMSGERPAAELGMLARLRLRRGAPPAAEVCPVRNEGESAVPLAGDPRRAETEAMFTDRLRTVSAYVRKPAALGPFGEDGCAPITPVDPTAR